MERGSNEKRVAKLSVTPLSPCRIGHRRRRGFAAANFNMLIFGVVNRPPAAPAQAGAKLGPSHGSNISILGPRSGLKY